MTTQQYFFDDDGDGFGDPDNIWITCDPVTDGQNQSDCDDNDPTINPDGIEVLLDGIDQDCDGTDRFHPYMGTEQYNYAYEVFSIRPIDCIMTWNTQGVAVVRPVLIVHCLWCNDDVWQCIYKQRTLWWFGCR